MTDVAHNAANPAAAADDRTLLRAYASHNDQAAFATLARRHVDLVYSAAVRQVRDPHGADDVTQAVFIILAKKAGKLSNEVALAGWLLTATRYAARDALKARRRREKHERRVAEMNLRSTDDRPARNDDGNWSDVASAIDDALAKLTRAGRTAVVLRFFEGKSFREVGEALGVNETAAKQRVFRALERLRAHLGRRGIGTPSSAVALGALLTGNAVRAAPAGALATSLAAAGAGAKPAGLTLATAALRAIAFAQAKWAAAWAAVVLTLAVAATLIVRQSIGGAASAKPIGPTPAEVIPIVDPAPAKAAAAAGPTGPTGVVIEPAGKPADGAEVVFCSSSHFVQFKDAAPVASAAHTDAGGRFTLPVIGEPAEIVVRHAAGYACTTLEELAASPTVRLQPWAIVRGVATAGGGPIPNARLTLTTFDLTYRDRGRPIVRQQYTAVADAAGNFTFDRVPPIRMGLYRRYHESMSLPTVVEPEPGEILDVAFGAGTRTVVGKVLPPEGYNGPINWRNDPAHVHYGMLYRTGYDDHGLRLWAWLPRIVQKWLTYLWVRTEPGLAWETGNFPAQFQLAADGSFMAEGVPPGRYVLRVEYQEYDRDLRHWETVIRLGANVVVPPPTDPAQAAPADDLADLGAFRLTEVPHLEVGKPAPEFTEFRAGRPPVKLSDYSGKYVLVFKWGHITRGVDYEKDVPQSARLARKYAGDPRLIVIGINESADARHAADREKAEPGIIWTTSRLEDPTPNAYWSCAGNAILIAPDGTVTSKRLRGEAIAQAVEAALGLPRPKR